MDSPTAKDIFFRQPDEEGEYQYFQISTKFLAFLEKKHKLRIIKRLGEGMVKTGLKAINLGNSKYPKNVVILITFGGLCEELKDFNDHMLELRELQQSKVIPVKNMMRIYEPIISPYPPTEDKRYCPNTIRETYTLQIVEFVDKILLEILYEHRYDTELNKLGIVANICQQLYIIYDNIDNAGYVYGDVNSDNIGVRNGKLIYN